MVRRKLDSMKFVKSLFLAASAAAILSTTNMACIPPPLYTREMEAKAQYESKILTPRYDDYMEYGNYIDFVRKTYNLNSFSEIVVLQTNKEASYRERPKTIATEKNAAQDFGKGYTFTCFIPDTLFKQGFYDFMSIFVDDMHTRAEIVNKGVFIKGRKIEQASLVNAVKNEKEMNDLFNTLKHTITCRHQLLDGEFSYSMSEHLRQEVEHSYVLWYFDLWKYKTDNNVVSDAVEELFYSGWLNRIVTIEDDKFVIKVDGERKEYEIPKNLVEHFKGFL